MDYLVGALVLLAFTVLAAGGQRLSKWRKARRIRRHLCHTACVESRWCRCGCRDGMGGPLTGTRCSECGRQFVQDDEAFTGPWSSGHRVLLRPSESEITAENPAPKGFTSWGWERDREFRRARYEQEREGGGDGQV